MSLTNTQLEVIRLGEGEETKSGAQHGTAVAGLLIGASDSRVPGLLPGAELIAVDAFQRFGKSADIASIYDLVRALDLLVQRDVKVVNMSLTGPANAVLETSVKTAADRGMILVAAAGNDGPNAKPVYPAAYDDVIAVTAVTRGATLTAAPCVASMLILPLLASGSGLPRPFPARGKRPAHPSRPPS